MAEQLMETTWRTALWRQFGAAIAMLEHALLACPAPLWKERLWSEHPDHPLPPGFDQFWSNHVSRALRARLVSDRLTRRLCSPCAVHLECA